MTDDELQRFVAHMLRSLLVPASPFVPKALGLDLLLVGRHRGGALAQQVWVPGISTTESAEEARDRLLDVAVMAVAAVLRRNPDWGPLIRHRLEVELAAVVPRTDG